MTETSLFRGDANGDGTVDISDVLTIVDHVLGKNPSPFIHPNANVVVDDDTVDISDVLSVVDIILGKLK